MYRIVIFSRARGRGVNHYYDTLDLAQVVAGEVFQATGVVLGIDEVPAPKHRKG